MLPLSSYEDIVQLALSEDIGAGDITSESIISETYQANATMIAKDNGVICGLNVAETIFLAVDDALDVALHAKDGDTVSKGQKILSVSGAARSILTAERTALNFMQQLSGVATQTARLSGLIVGTKAKMCDTRKTIPGMRVLQKYAVVCGGGVNHRMGLYDAVLIKDNHIAVAGGVVPALKATEDCAKKIEIEVDTLDQFREALDAGAQYVLLDNMSPKIMREAVSINGGRAVLEASGGITDETIRAVAESGVDLISVGWITHSAPALDIGLDITIQSNQ